MILLADAPLSLRTALIVLNVLLGAFLLGVAFAAVRDRRQRRVTPPNQEQYHDDDIMEGSRLERIQAWALALFAIIAVSLPAYWLIEPARQDEMDEQFLETSVEQGEELYASSGTTEVALGCADCHGPDGQGGFAPPQVVSIPRDDIELASEEALSSTERVCAPNPEDEESLLCQVSWRAPSLNDAFLRFSREEITEIVTFGRPGTPMPAWGLDGGGAKNEQSIDNIVDFIESLQISSDEATAQQADLTDGQQLYEANCARCHTKHWSYAATFADSETFDILSVPGGGAFGPNLTGDVTLRQFPDIQDHIDFILNGSDFQAAYGTRGIGSGRMPGFAQMLTEDQVRAIVEYERSLDSGNRVVLDDLVSTADGAEGGESDDSDDGENGGEAEEETE